MRPYLSTRSMSFPVIIVVLMTLLTLLAIPASVVKGQNAAEFDIVLANGRVMDPESNTRRNSLCRHSRRQDRGDLSAAFARAYGDRRQRSCYRARLYRSAFARAG